MAKVGAPLRGSKPPSFGARVVVRVLNGQAIFQKWPRRRGRTTNPVTKAQNEKFKQANKLAKYASAQDQWMAIEVAKNSPLYPRDLLISAMYGRLFETLTIDGQEYVSVAVRDDISDDLDKVGGNVVGSLLYRAAEGWRGLLPGNAGETLQTQGNDLPPAWGGGGGGAGTYYTSQLPSTVTNSSPSATKGNPVFIIRDVTILEMACQLIAAPSFTYEGRIWSFDAANKLTALVGTTGPITGLGLFRQVLIRPLLVPAQLLAGTRYLIAWSRTDGPNNYILPMYATQSPRFLEGLPIDQLFLTGAVNNFTLLAVANPPIGQTIAVSFGGTFLTPLVLSL